MLKYRPPRNAERRKVVARKPPLRSRWCVPILPVRLTTAMQWQLWPLHAAIITALTLNAREARLEVSINSITRVTFTIRCSLAEGGWGRGRRHPADGRLIRCMYGGIRQLYVRLRWRETRNTAMPCMICLNEKPLCQRSKYLVCCFMERVSQWSPSASPIINRARTRATSSCGRPTSSGCAHRRSSLSTVGASRS